MKTILILTVLIIGGFKYLLADATQSEIDHVVQVASEDKRANKRTSEALTHYISRLDLMKIAFEVEFLTKNASTFASVDSHVEAMNQI